MPSTSPVPPTGSGRNPARSFGNPRADDLGGVNRRVTKFGEERQTADMILVAVAEHERINRP